MDILVKLNGRYYKAKLNDSNTSYIVKQNLPIKGVVKRWGDEIYFPVDFEAELEENAKEVLKVGDICFWPNGQAIAIFFGATPMSNTNEPRAADLVNVLGHIQDGINSFKSVKDGDVVEIVKVNV